MTTALSSAHGDERRREGGLAVYSVSLVDGCNVPMVVTLLEFATGPSA